MHVGVSAWRLSGQRLGIGRYIQYLLRYWNEQLEGDERVTLFVHEPLDVASEGLSDRFSVRVVRPKLTNALWETVLLPRHTADIDVLFGPSYTLPLRYPGRSAVAIHSMDLARHGHHPWWQRFTYEAKYRRSCESADLVIVNCESVGERVTEYFDIPRSKQEVIWLGADDAFQPVEDEALLRETRIRYLGEDVPFIVFVGGMSRRRNVPLLLEAFAEVRRRSDIPHRVLIVGPNRAGIPLDDLVEELGIADRVVQTDGHFREHRELAAIYSAADAYVMPSGSEGFLLTLAEAMACGTPAITTSWSALGEVANGYGYTIDELEVGPLADAIDEVLGDPDLRARLRASGLERAELMRWRLTAQKTLEALRRVAKGDSV